MFIFRMFGTAPKRRRGAEVNTKLLKEDSKLLLESIFDLVHYIFLFGFWILVLIFIFPMPTDFFKQQSWVPFLALSTVVMVALTIGIYNRYFKQSTQSGHSDDKVKK